MKIGIIGAGVTGLSAAHHLAKDHDVTVFESAPSVGGLLHSLTVGKASIERHYHHIFTTDKQIIALITELGLGDKLTWSIPPTAFFTGNKLIPFTTIGDILRFPKIDLFSRIRLLVMAAYLKGEFNWRQFQNQTAVSWIKQYMGESVYNHIWGPLLTAKFGKYSSTIGMQWFWSRIHCRSLRLGYLRGGFIQIYIELEKTLLERGVQFLFNQRVSQISAYKGKPSVAANGKRHTFDKVIVTIATPVFAKIAKDLPKNYTKQITKVQYLGAQNVILILKKSLSPYYWINITDTTLPFLVAVEHTNFIPAKEYDTSHIVYFGRYVPMDSMQYLQDEEQSIADAIRVAKQINPEFSKSWIKRAIVSNGSFAQPIITAGYDKIRPSAVTPIPNVYLANMSQIYPYDRGQNYSIALGKTIADEITR